MASVFKTVDYPAVGASYRSPSLPASAQRTVNMYPEAVQNGLEEVVLHNFPGLKRELSGNSGEFDRGLHRFKGNLYQVAGSQFYLINSSFSRTAIGSVAGSGRVSMADNGDTMVIVTGGAEYTYDGSTFTEVTLGLSPTSVAYLNNRFFYDDSDGRVGVSSVGVTTIPSGSYFTPESAPDNLVRTYIFNQFIFLFGERTIEPWQNVASGLPPVERMNGAIIEDVGLAGRNAVDSTEKAIYFVSRKGEAQQLQGFSPQQVSTVAVANEWRSYTLSDAIVNTVQTLGLDFVVFSFPADAKTWVYVEDYGLWFELEHSTDAQRWRGNSVSDVYGQTVIADYATGNIYTLDPDTFTDNGVITVRERIFAPLAGEKFQRPRQFFQITEFGLSIETGLGNAAELNPLIAIAFSTDGGKSFSNERFKKVGQEGEYRKDVKVNSNQHFKDLTVRIRYTEPNKFSLFSSYIKLRESGDQ